MHKFIAHQYSHHPLLPSASTSVSVSASRRSACDRCRGQKLRCIRDAGPESVAADSAGGGGCRRCLKMGADCKTTTTTTASRNRSSKGGIHTTSTSTSSSTLTSDPEKHTDTIPTTSDNWLSWDLPISNSETQNFDADDNNNNNNNNDQAGLDIDMFPADEAGIGFQIFDPMLFDDSSSTLLLHDENAVQTVQKEQPHHQKEKGKEEEINIHTIASTLDHYLLQLSAGPPEITLSKILFTTENEKEKGNCQRAYTIDSILQYTTHFITILKTYPLNDHHTPVGAEKKVEEISTESLLRMLAIYTTIIKLFLILFGHINIFLREGIQATNTGMTSGRGNGIAAIEPVPDVQFIGFDIQSGHLQVTLFIQIVSHLIRSMETYLGIPSEHMLEKYPQAKDIPNGAIIDAVMHRETQTTDPLHGHGGVPALRKEMDTVKQLLEQIPL